MINLLPDNVRRDVYRSYCLRLLALGFVFVGCALFLGAFGLVPATIELRSEIAFQQAIIPRALSGEKGGPTIDPVAVAQDVSRRVRILTQEDAQGLVPHEAIALVLAHKGRITLEGFSYVPDKGSLTVRGTAPDRAALLAFSHELEADPQIANIDLPVSTLLPEGSRPFTVAIMLKPKTTSSTPSTP